jgi:Tfp pilus assembly protein PilO
MRTGRADQLWTIGGALGAIALLAIGWLLFISPQKAQTAKLLDREDAAQQRLIVLQHRLTKLRQQNRDLPRYQARLARDRQALPMVSGLSDFLRELQAMGDSTGVTVSGLVVGSPTKATGATAQVFALPLTLTAAGATTGLDQFLDQLQRVQPRAVLITNASTAPAVQGTSFADSVTLTLSLQVFVAAAASASQTQSPAKTT